MSKKSRKDLKTVLVGASGRMGLEIADMARAQKLIVVSKVDGDKDWKSASADADGVIDFSTPTGTMGAIDWCLKHNKALVCGTTGLSPKEMAKLKSAAQKIPILYSANMSLGVAVMKQMLQAFGAVKSWDFAMIEAHHKHKKDKPSGTAIMLVQTLEKIIDQEVECHSLRGGEVPGIHEVLGLGPGESITIRHTAFNRTVFAQGAVRAAKWLFDKKPPGLYDLSDLYSSK